MLFWAKVWDSLLGPSVSLSLSLSCPTTVFKTSNIRLSIWQISQQCSSTYSFDKNDNIAYNVGLDKTAVSRSRSQGCLWIKFPPILKHLPCSGDDEQLDICPQRMSSIHLGQSAPACASLSVCLCVCAPPSFQSFKFGIVLSSFVSPTHFWTGTKPTLTSAPRGSLLL